MALIKCPECSKQISDSAAACPSCAYPINQHQTRQAVQTIEQTSKKWKGLQVISGLILIIGLFMFFSVAGSSNPADTNIGAAVMFIGLVGYITARVGAWWHHQ